jgi:catechol 2,3-dioxygenase-like lactoylglutathione lyase family enzyme
MPPEPAEIGPLNHVALPTADPERGAEFYCRVLGFVRTARPGFSFRGAWLWRPETRMMVHLIHDAAFHPDLENSINTRIGHLAFQTADYDKAVDALRRHSVELVERVLPDYGYRQVFFRDPDGNLVELGEWPSPEIMLAHPPALSSRS